MTSPTLSELEVAVLREVAGLLDEPLPMGTSLFIAYELLSFNGFIVRREKMSGFTYDLTDKGREELKKRGHE